MVVPNVVLIACGSFSPPTPMHFRMFEIARDHFRQMGTHNVVGGIMSPVHDAYKKKGLVSAHHRCNMIRLGLQTSDWIRLSDWETRQDGWTRTRMSLQYHQNYINSYLNDDLNGDDTTDLQLPQWLPDLDNSQAISGPVQLKLLCGADILESFSVPNLWDTDDLETILRQHGLVVITRSGSNPEQFIFNSDLLSKYRRNITLITNWVANEVSSTMARRLISRGDSVKYLLDDRIVDYIQNKGLYLNNNHTTSTTSDNNKYIQSSPVNDGIVLKLNKLGSSQEISHMMITPSPDDVLDAPSLSQQPIITPEKDLVNGGGNFFCCDPMPKSKRTPDSRKSSRRRRGPGQAVQVLFDDRDAATPGHAEVRRDPRRESCHKSPQSHAALSSQLGHLSIISSAPQLNHSPPLHPAQTPISTDAVQPKKSSAKLTRHTSLKQPKIPTEDRDRLDATGLEMADGRNYDDMIKFILTEHGIKVISEKEFVV